MKKIIIYTLLFFLPLTAVTIGILTYFKFVKSVSKIEVPQLPQISFNNLIKFSRFSLEKAPSQSLVGNISSLSGEVLYESRLATESAKITTSQEIQQGESLATGLNGSATISFKDVAEIKLENESGVDIVQTLPTDLVFRQTLGSVEYKKLGQVPVSIRVGHLLVENGGELKVSFTADSPITTIVNINGSAVIAYNDLNNDSQVVNLSSGQTLTFNESNRKSNLSN